MIDSNLSKYTLRKAFLHSSRSTGSCIYMMARYACSFFFPIIYVFLRSTAAVVLRKLACFAAVKFPWADIFAGKSTSCESFVGKEVEQYLCWHLRCPLAPLTAKPLGSSSTPDESQQKKKEAKRSKSWQIFLASRPIYPLHTFTLAPPFPPALPPIL